jgi:hypothetical protein
MAAGPLGQPGCCRVGPVPGQGIGGLTARHLHGDPYAKAHTVITEYLDRADSILLRLNLVLLLFVSLLPFPTHMVAEYLSSDNYERIAVTVYGLNPAPRSCSTWPSPCS